MATDEKILGLSQTTKGFWAWGRKRKGEKTISIGLGGNEEKARSIALELNRMFDNGVNEKELRAYAKQELYDPMAGLRLIHQRSWAWTRKCKGEKTISIGLGTDEEKARLIVPELSRMFEDGANEKELRAYAKQELYDLMAGLYQIKTGSWVWMRTHKSETIKIGLGVNEEKARSIVPELNRMFDAGATEEELRLYAMTALSTTTPATTTPDQPDHIKPHFDWLKGGK
jgi:hypothetical protein